MAAPGRQRATECRIVVKWVTPMLIVFARLWGKLKKETVLGANEVDEKTHTRLIACEAQDAFCGSKKVPNDTDGLNILEQLEPCTSSVVRP